MIDLRINFLRESSETMPRPVERVSGPFIDVTMSMAQLSAGPMAQSGRAQCSSVTVADYRCDTATGAAGLRFFSSDEDGGPTRGWRLEPPCLLADALGVCCHEEARSRLDSGDDAARPHAALCSA
jgi:hypothetical protein